jgi:ligand-binding sensor domain-containing protein
MWFGTTHGLYRYDGYEFKYFQHDPKDPSSLSHNRIHSVYEDSRGILWVGTYSGLNKYDNQTQRFIRFTHDGAVAGSLSSNNITAIYEDAKGLLWIGTENGGLNQYEPKQGLFVQLKHQESDFASLSIIRLAPFTRIAKAPYG